MATPSWKIPPGVSRGTWDYVNSKSIAADYDKFVDGHPLLELDIQFVKDYLPEPAADLGLSTLRIADFGCGTGRVSHALSPLGHHLLNVDLSQNMLAELRAKTQHPHLNTCIHANLPELELPKESIDLGLCLFSSYGMIRGSEHRVRFLRAARQALRPGGRLILHAHNRYQRLWDPSGPAWLLSSWRKSFRRRVEFGDHVYTYRGLPAMFLHIFGKRELYQEIRQAGFRKVSLHPISSKGDHLLKPARLDWLRAGGYFSIAEE